MSLHPGESFSETFDSALNQWSSRGRSTVIVVVGAEGEPGYGKQFAQRAQRWENARHHPVLAFRIAMRNAAQAQRWENARHHPVTG